MTEIFTRPIRTLFWHRNGIAIAETALAQVLEVLFATLMIGSRHT